MSELSFPSMNLLSRVVSYPTVQHLCTSAKTYYSSAKETSPLVKYGLEKAESKLTELAEVSKPVLQPYLQGVDSFGCRQLDLIENRLSSLNNVCSSSKEAIQKKIVKINETKDQVLKADVVSSVTNTLQTKVVQPLVASETSNKLKSTLEQYLTNTERFVEKYFPKEETEHSVGEQPSPLTRVYTLSAHVSKSLHGQVLSQMNHLKPRSVDSLKNIVHVNLIEYASKYLDSAEPLVAEVSSKYRTGVRLATDLKQSVFSAQLPDWVKATYEKASSRIPNYPLFNLLDKKTVMKTLEEVRNHSVQYVQKHNLANFVTFLNTSILPEWVKAYLPSQQRQEPKEDLETIDHNNPLALPQEKELNGLQTNASGSTESDEDGTSE